MINMFLSNNPSSGDINSSNLPCFMLSQDLRLRFVHFFTNKLRWLIVQIILQEKKGKRTKVNLGKARYKSLFSARFTGNI